MINTNIFSIFDKNLTMGLISRFKAAALAFNDNTNNELYKSVFSFFNTAFYTLNRNKETFVKEGYQNNISVYTAVKLISGKAANARFYAYTMKDGKRVELSPDHYANKILRKPNEMIRQQQFVEACASWLSITGDLYLYKLTYDTGENKGKVARMYALPSQYVQIIGGGAMKPVSGYRLVIGDQAITFSTDEVIHLSYFNPNWDISGSQLYGQSPLMAALSTIQSSNEGTNVKIRSFQNGGVAGIISSKDKDTELSVEQKSALQNFINTRAMGSNNAKSVLATDANLDWLQIGLSPTDLEVLKSISFDEQMIAKAFGIDPILFSTDTASYNNKREAYKSLVTNVVVPLLNLLVDAYTDVFADDVYVGYDIKHFEELQENLKEQIDALNTAWWISPNQKLEQMGIEISKDPLMDKIYIPSNLIPIEESVVNVDSVKNFDYLND